MIRWDGGRDYGKGGSLCIILRDKTIDETDYSMKNMDLSNAQGVFGMKNGLLLSSIFFNRIIVLSSSIGRSL